MNEFMESKGFPYRLDTIHNMFHMLRTKAHKNAVVVNVEGRYFVGYHDSMKDSEYFAAAARRIRKYRVIDVAIF